MRTGTPVQHRCADNSSMGKPCRLPGKSKHAMATDGITGVMLPEVWSGPGLLGGWPVPKGPRWRIEGEHHDAHSLHSDGLAKGSAHRQREMEQVQQKLQGWVSTALLHFEPEA